MIPKSAGLPLIALAICFANPAVAAEATYDRGLYVSAAVGIAAPLGSVNGSGGVSTELDSGLALNFAAGYRLGNFRIETELGGQELGFGGQSVDGVQQYGDLDIGSASLSIATIMGNLYYDVDLGTKLRPYVGVGAGVAQIAADYFYDDPEGKYCAPSCTFLGLYIYDGEVNVLEDEAWVGAFQAMAGFTFEVWDQIDLFIQYRFLATMAAEFTDFDGASFKQDGIMTHSVQAGVRYFF